MFKPKDLVFAKVEGWYPWPGRIMCEVSPDVFKIFFYGTRQESLVKSERISSSEGNIALFSKKYGHDQGWDYALEEMNNGPDIFTVSYDDFCHQKCMTCDKNRRESKVINSQRRVDDFNYSLNGSVASMKRVEVVMKNVLYNRETKHGTDVRSSRTSKEIIKKNERMSRKKITEKNRKDKGRLTNQLYFLPCHFLSNGNPGLLVKMLEKLSCSMCTKVFRNTIGLQIHLYENHPEYRPETPKSGLKGTRLKEPVNNSFVDVDDLLPSSESSDSDSLLDDIGDLLQSSDIEDLLKSSESDSSDGKDDLLRSSDRDPAIPPLFIDLT